MSDSVYHSCIVQRQMIVCCYCLFVWVVGVWPHFCVCEGSGEDAMATTTAAGIWLYFCVCDQSGEDDDGDSDWNGIDGWCA